MIILNILFIILFSSVLFIIYNNKKKYLENKFKEDFYNNHYQELTLVQTKLEQNFIARRKEAQYRFDQEIERLNEQRKQAEQSLFERKQSIEQIIEQLECRMRETEKKRDEEIQHGKEKIELELDGVRKLRTEQVNTQLTAEFAEKRAAAEEEFKRQSEELQEQISEYRVQLGGILLQIEEYQEKQTAINQEIARRRMIEEERDHFRINLDENASKDMQILLSIRPNLTMRENLDKLIYEVYVSKPTAEMTKRVLCGRAPSGIYKITRLKTGEVYIGKSTDVKKRWAEHSKTAYGVGSIAHSILHTTMKKDGIENFTFELLEEVPKDKLTEREKYWINFFDSKNYGLNERNG